MPDQRERILLEDAAQRMQTTALHVLMHIKRGLLQAEEVQGQWHIDRKSLDELMAQTGGGKAEGLCASGCSGKHACSGCS